MLAPLEGLLEDKIHPLLVTQAVCDGFFTTYKYIFFLGSNSPLSSKRSSTVDNGEQFT
jgi:hypothetical protein